MQVFSVLNRRASSYFIVRIVRARPRLFGCLAIAILLGYLQPADWRPSTRFLIAWNVGVWSYLALAVVVMRAANRESMSRRAAIQDEGRFAMLVLACLTAIVSIGAILVELAAIKDMSGAPKALHIALAGSTIVSSWLFIHMMFALHYAHEYYLSRPDPSDPEERYNRGLDFPSSPSPDYADFLYFSYVIGVASQTADVAISTREMRHVSLAHSIVSFFFNTIVLALTINIAAGLI